MERDLDSHFKELIFPDRWPAMECPGADMEIDRRCEYSAWMLCSSGYCVAMARGRLEGAYYPKVWPLKHRDLSFATQ